MTGEFVIEDIREVSDEVAENEICAIIRSRSDRVSIAEIAEKTCFPFEQIIRIVDDWS